MAFRVIGHPVSHSLSPWIHRKFAEQLGLNIDYQIQELPLGGFESGVKKLIRDGVKGFSVTLPFKQEAYALAEVLTPRAMRAKSVNTLFMHEGQLHGDNTDGAGFLNNLIKDHRVILKSKKVLILGSGGAALGIIGPVLDAGAFVTVFSRSLLSPDHPLRLFDYSQGLSFLTPREFIKSELESGSGSGSALEPEMFDLVINATPLSFQSLEAQKASKNLWSSAWIGSDTLAYDLSYDREARNQTCFTQWALHQGAKKAVDGLGMLVEQAALQFEIFMNISVPQELIKLVMRDLSENMFVLA